MSTTASVVSLPDCDIHKYDMQTPGVPAKYDAATTRGSWANMCEPCWVANRATPDLGTGKGQMFVLVDGKELAGPSRTEQILAALAAGDMRGAADAAGDGDLAELL